MEIRTLAQEEKKDALALAEEVFLKQDSLGYSEEGRDSFLSFLNDHGQELTYIGAFRETLCGIIGFRPDTFHIALFFVKTEEQGKGIGHLLMETIKDIAKERNLVRITVNAAETAVPFYRQLGFTETDSLQDLGGIRFIPMEYLMQKEALGRKVTVIIDRPYGSLHPFYPDTEYTCNYGYIEGTDALDGEFQDAYVYGPEEPLEKFTGTVIGIVYRKNDIETKWIVSDRDTYDKQDVINTIGFIEQYFDTQIIWK
ncbi:MAG: GNAT family N-acetyltransferase [Solobacterium sp.]|nr:GNAT family N-acetyltransferase [Solobacterium sp.]